MTSAGILVGLVILATGPAVGQEAAGLTDQQLIEILRRRIPRIMSASGTPGLSLALARRGEVIWEEGFGFADLEARSPMTPDTVLRSGSMGKTYTATAVLQLVEQGVLELHQPVNEVFDFFEVHNPLGDREVTVHDLLTHRSGLTGNAAGCDFAPPPELGEHLADGYAEDFFPSYGGTLLPRWSQKVGAGFQYSNFGIATLGFLVEVANPDGLSFSDYVQEHVMDRLAMTSSQFPPVQDAEHVRADVFSRLSSGHARLGRLYLPTPTIYFAEYPAGTVVTTPADHVRLLLAYLGGGVLGEQRILEPETVAAMLTPQTDPFLGLVWFLQDVGTPSFRFGHGGAHMYGWNNYFCAWPELDAAIVVATNQWSMVPGRSTDVVEIPALVARLLSQPATAEEEEHVGVQAPMTFEPAGRGPGAGPESWPWKCSYVIGLIMAERLAGGLGIDSPITPELVTAMVDGAMLRTDGDPTEPIWDAEGFRAGVEAMLAVEMTISGIRAFFSSSELRVTSDELEQVGRALGSNGAPLFGVLQ